MRLCLADRSRVESRLSDRGTTTIATDTEEDFQDNSTLENYGSLALSDGDTVGYQDGVDADGDLANELGATLSYTGSASNSSTNINVPLDNYGAVTVGRGTLTTTGGSSTFSAGDSGTYDVRGYCLLGL